MSSTARAGSRGLASRSDAAKGLALLWVGMALLCPPIAVGETEESAAKPTESSAPATERSAGYVTQLGNGIVSFGHDTNCPGCRAFLAGYGSAEAMHSPSCSCNAGDGTGGGPMAEPEDYQELVASDYRAARGYESAVPGMVGDFFGAGYRIRLDGAGPFSGTVANPYSNVSIAGGDRRYKIADNNSPFPIDRVFFNYNHFHNALVTANGNQANLDRGVAGFESTFLDQWWSIEGRLPFVSGLNGDQVFDSPTANNVSNEFGNISLALKRLLFRDDFVAASLGIAVVLPTGSDSRIFNDPGDIEPLVAIDNNAYYLQPFFGMWWTPTDSLFSQLAVQLDVDGRGNDVYVPSDGSSRVGVIQDQTLLFVDWSMGYWIYHDPYSASVVTGVAPMVEVHYSTTLKDTDVVDLSNDSLGGTNEIRNPFNRQDVINLTGALRFEIAGRSYLTVGGVVPLRTGDDEKFFDAEFSAQYTRFY